MAGGETPEEAPSAASLADAPEVRQALSRIAAGGYAEAVVRMMILLAAARGGVRRSRLARSNALMQNEPPFSDMTASARQALIREQTVIASMAPAEALASAAEAAAEAGRSPPGHGLGRGRGRAGGGAGRGGAGDAGASCAARSG